ncbi:MAG: hypothetical protein WBB19_03140 [Desulforhopalus sp.]
MRKAMITMRKARHWLLIFCFLLAVVPYPAVAEKVPHEIAGIALGSSVDNYPEIIRNNFLKEVVVTDWHGFRKGIISYGTCKHIDQILKIDMKYEDKSKDFYQKLLKEFRQQFGEPDAWSGDSFGVMLAWKWHFVDKEKNRVSLTLQYNGKNSDETIGNIVKLSFPGKMEEERLCFIDICEDRKDKTDAKRREELKKSDWSHFVPR